MYLLLQTNLNYFGGNNRYEIRQKIESKKLQRIKLEIQNKKEKIQSTPNLFESDLSSDEEDYSISKKNYDPKKSINIKTNNTEKDYNQELKIDSKLINLKKILRVLDIIFVIINILCIFFALNENKHYSKINKMKRILYVEIAQCIYKGLDKNNKKCSKFNFDEDLYNLEFGKGFLDKINFNDQESISKLHLNFTVDNYCKNLRFFIFILSIFGICLSFITSEIQHYRIYFYLIKKDKNYFSKEYFISFLFETFIQLLIPYPKIDKVFFYIEYGQYMMYPFSTILSTCCLLRIIFIFKLFNVFSLYTSVKAEKISDNYGSRANLGFAFKVLSKEHPFFVLSIIFLMSCIIFGYGLRNFETLYWEHFPDDGSYQSWEYIWNCFWFVFVTMTTVGYGDFFPKTTFGRVLSIFCSLVGCYFVSSLMLFLTNLTEKNEKEEKAYKLIKRLEYKKEIKNLQSHLIFNGFKYVKLIKLKKEEEELDNSITTEIREINKNLNNFKEIMVTIIIKINKINTKIKNSSDLSKEKDELFSIYEKLIYDFNNINYELSFIETINNTMKQFTNFQIKTLENLKKNLILIKIFYEIISKNPNMFKKLKKFKFPTENLELFKLNNIDEDELYEQKTNIINKSDVNYWANQNPFMFNNNNKNNGTKLKEIAEEYQEPMLYNFDYNANNIYKNFYFLFDEKINEYKKLNSKYISPKTKVNYKDVLNKIEKRKADKEYISHKKKLKERYFSENNIAKFSEHFKIKINNSENENSDS